MDFHQISKDILLKWMDFLPNGQSWKLQIVSKSFYFSGLPILANGYSMDYRQGNLLTSIGNPLVWEANPLISKGLDLQDLPLGKKWNGCSSEPSGFPYHLNGFASQSKIKWVFTKAQWISMKFQWIPKAKSMDLLPKPMGSLLKSIDCLAYNPWNTHSQIMEALRIWKDFEMIWSLQDLPFGRKSNRFSANFKGFPFESSGFAFQINGFPFEVKRLPC